MRPRLVTHSHIHEKGRALQTDVEPAAPESSELASEADRFEETLLRDRPWVWWATLLGPFAVPVVILVMLTLEHGWDFTRLLLGTAVATFFFFGRFVILGGESPGDESRFLSPAALAVMVFTMDVMAASLIAFHAGVLWKLPVVGKRLRSLVEQGQGMIAANPRVRRATFLSIVAFVMFPLASTGSIGGSLFGRLLGMSRIQTFLAVLVGSVLGCGAMYYGAALINRYVDRSNPLVVAAGIACTVAVILVLTRRFRAMTK